MGGLFSLDKKDGEISVLCCICFLVCGCRLIRAVLGIHVIQGVAEALQHQ